MSQEDLAVMRRWFDAWNRADLDAFADLYDADAELITDPSWVEAGPFHGRAADATSVNTIESGRIVRQQYYFDYAKALEAVGLSE
jgi:Domain of unknown function (DUF4440)